MKNDSTTKIKIWEPPSQTYRFTVSKLKKLLEELPDSFSIHIDDFDYIGYEIDWENGCVDFWRDYKGD